VQDEALALQAAHHLLVAHGLAVQAIRAIAPHAEVGIVLDMFPSETDTDLPEDHALVERAWQTGSAWFLDTLLRASYPASALQTYGARAPHILPGDMALIAQRLTAGDKLLFTHPAAPRPQSKPGAWSGIH